MGKSYIAAAPLVIAKDETGRDVYAYEGAQIPDNVTDESLKRLADEGFITEVKAAEEAPEIPEGDPADGWTNKQLTAYAKRESIDLAGATKHDELFAAVAKK